MKFTRHTAWLVAFVTFLALQGEALARPRVTAIRRSSGQGHTRIVLDLTEPARYLHQSLKAPDRMMIDLAADLDASVVSHTIDDDVIVGVRIGPGEQGSRIVFDLKGPADYRVTKIERDRYRPHRVVIDLFGGVAAPAPRAGAQTPRTRSNPTTDGSAVPSPPVAQARPERTKPFLVVVDAGHGGEDPGARGFHLEEKDVCLSVARHLVEELNTRPGFQARLSRDGDYFIPLRKRIQIAERHNADAFVSIHANASKSRSARGTEVYFLSLSGATDEASRELAHLENSADLIGGITPEAEDDLSSILFDMQQTDVLQKGSLLAEAVVNSLRGYAPLQTRGVKQAGFVVLKSPRIPSILVETAFITHREENSLLKKADFRKTFARRVADGVVKYFASVSVTDAY